MGSLEDGIRAIEEWVQETEKGTVDRALDMRAAQAVAGFMAGKIDLESPLVTYQCAAEPETCGKAVAFVYHTNTGPVWLPVRRESGRANQYGFEFARVLGEELLIKDEPFVQGAVCDDHPIVLGPSWRDLVADYEEARRSGLVRIALVPNMESILDRSVYNDSKRLRGREPAFGQPRGTAQAQVPIKEHKNLRNFTDRCAKICSSAPGRDGCGDERSYVFRCGSTCRLRTPLAYSRSLPTQQTSVCTEHPKKLTT